MTEMNAFIPSHFADLYISLLTSLLEANPNGLSQIYEFSAQHFENKLKERSGETKRNAERFIQRDIPNSSGKKQFLPDFSYDSVLILQPALPFLATSPEENAENFLNKEKQLTCHLNDLTDQQEQERNLLRKLQTFQKDEEINRLTNPDIYQYELQKALLENQEKRKKDRECAKKISDDKRQVKRNGSLNEDYMVPIEQEIILDLENILKKENLEKIMDYNGYESDNFKSLYKYHDVLDKASNTEEYQDPFRKCFCPVHRNAAAVPEDNRETNVYQKEEQKCQLEKHNTVPLNSQIIRSPKTAEIFVDEQFSIGNEVLNQIVELTKLLPTCLEVMGKMLNDLDDRYRIPEGNVYITSDRKEIKDNFSKTLRESCKNDTDEQNIDDKIFLTTSSQTETVGSLELLNKNSSGSTTPMFEYVCDVVKAAKRLLHSVTVKDTNYLPIEQIIDDLLMRSESNNGFDEFQKILDDSCITSDRPEVPNYFSETLCKSCKNDTDEQNISNKIFCTTSSQTEIVGSLELRNKNSSVSTTPMFEYVCDVVNAAQRLLYFVTVKDNNHLAVEQITDDLLMHSEINNGFDEFQKFLDNSYITSNQPEVPNYFSEILGKSCKKDTDVENTSDKMFCEMTSQTDFVGGLELLNKNGSVSTTAMYEYVCDVVKAVKRLLHSVSAKDSNQLPVEKITDGLLTCNESDIGFDEFQKSLDFWKYFLDNSENAPFRMDQNNRLESLQKEHSDNLRDHEEDKNPWQYETKEKTKKCQIHRKSESDHNIETDIHHSYGHQTTEDTNACICSQIQQDIGQESNKYSEKCDPRERSTRKKDQTNRNSNKSCSCKESSYPSSIQIQKLLDGLRDLDIDNSRDNLSKSLSDSVISSISNQDENKTALANALLSELQEIYQTNEDDDPFFHSSSHIMPIFANVPPPKGKEKTNKSTGDLHHRQKTGRLKPEKSSEGKTEHKNNGLFSLLDPRRATTKKEKKDRKRTKYEHRHHNDTNKRRDLENTSETGEDIIEIDKPTLSDSEQTGPINTDSFFISTPFIQQLLQSAPEKETTKSTGDLLQNQTRQAYKKYGPRKLFRRKCPAKDELKEKTRGSFSLLDPKRSYLGRREPSYKKLRTVDVASLIVEAETDSQELVVHELHPATSKLQMRILKCRRVYKESMPKTGTHRGVNDLDDNWHDMSVPVTGRNWLRSYFTTRMIRRYQKQLETDKKDNEIENLATPMLKHRECSYGFGSYFSQRSLLGSVRMWYFSKKLREYEKVSNL